MEDFELVLDERARAQRAPVPGLRIDPARRTGGPHPAARRRGEGSGDTGAAPAAGRSLPAGIEDEMVATPYAALVRSRLQDRLGRAIRALADEAVSDADAFAIARNITTAALAELDTVGTAPLAA